MHRAQTARLTPEFWMRHFTKAIVDIRNRNPADRPEAPRGRTRRTRRYRLLTGDTLTRGAVPCQTFASFAKAIDHSGNLFEPDHVLSRA